MNKDHEKDIHEILWRENLEEREDFIYAQFWIHPAHRLNVQYRYNRTEEGELLETIIIRKKPISKTRIYHESSITLDTNTAFITVRVFDTYAYAKMPNSEAIKVQDYFIEMEYKESE